MNTCLSRKIMMCVATIALATHSYSLMAQVSIGNGASCVVKNFGSNTARKGVRYFDGEIYNATPSTKLSVVCPLYLPFGQNTHTVLVRFGNGADVTQSYKCTLTEYDIFSNALASFVRTVDIDSGVSLGLEWNSVRRTDELGLGRFNLECGLPPASGIGTVAVESFGGP